MSELDLDAYTYDLDRAHVFHSWSVQGDLSPLVIAGGKGSTVWDHAGREYLDFSSQLINTNIGHQHPKVVAAIKEQADLLTTVAPGHANLARGEAAKRVLERAGTNFSKVFFTNAGADAVENAIRLARVFTGRNKVLSAYRSYHGNTGAAIVATGDPRRLANEYATGHVHFFGPFPYRSEFWSENVEQESERALHHLERIVQVEGPETIAAILMEPIPGSAGILVPPPGYLQGMRAIADKYGIVLIFDEVMSGFGRTGAWFAHQLYGATPDLITFAKGVNSGYVPAGGVAISAEIADSFEDRMFPGGLTYSGHPLAMASIVASIDAMADEGIVDHAATIGHDHLGPGLAALAEKHPIIGEVRGLGVFWALELVRDPSTKAPISAEQLADIRTRLIDRGLLPFTVANRIHVAPPCIVTPAEITRGLSILDEVLGVS